MVLYESNNLNNNSFIQVSQAAFNRAFSLLKDFSTHSAPRTWLSHHSSFTAPHPAVYQPCKALSYALQRDTCPPIPRGEQSQKDPDRAIHTSYGAAEPGGSSSSGVAAESDP